MLVFNSFLIFIFSSGEAAVEEPKQENEVRNQLDRVIKRGTSMKEVFVKSFFLSFAK